MKKIFAFCIAAVTVCVMLTAVNASDVDPIISPTAPVYSDTTKKDDGGRTIPIEEDDESDKYTTNSGGYVPGRNEDDPDAPGDADGDVDGRSDRYRTTGKFTNNGKDDPDSPNYTGEMSVSKDDSSTSPDTAAEDNYACIAAAIVTLCTVSVSAGILIGKKKNENESNMA